MTAKESTLRYQTVYRQGRDLLPSFSVQTDWDGSNTTLFANIVMVNKKLINATLHDSTVKTGKENIFTTCLLGKTRMARTKECMFHL